MAETNGKQRLEGNDRGIRLTVMVVDDDNDLLVVMGHLLEAEGYAVVPCRDAASALDHLRRGTQPDIIVLDLLMPKMSGWQFRVEQKRDVRWASIPVIALSGDLSPQAKAIDAAVYLTKPLEHDAFAQAVRGVARDLERKRTIGRASEVQRLVSLGTLVGGIAHEINNPLTFVSGNVDALQRQWLGKSGPATFDPQEMEQAVRALERVRTGIDRIMAVVRSVEVFAFADSAVLQPTDVHEVLEASLRVVSNELRHCARLERAYEAVPHVLADPARLGQVVLNLLLNAVFAIREHERDGHVVRVESTTRGERVVVTIADSASQHAADLHLFDPLTSDGTAGRMGLRFGLAISRELVENLGGSIEIETNEPEGSRFRVLLPSCGKVSYPAPAPPPPPLEAGRRPALLVVDDEPLVCELLEAMLSVDYDVSSFSKPADALAALRDGHFDVVLCDVMMPEIDGIALYERAVQAHPQLGQRFIFVTGGAFTERARLALPGTGRPVLRKPCRRDDLLAAIEKTLRDPSSAS